MKLQDILTKYNYHNIIQEDNTIVIENDYKTTIILSTNYTKRIKYNFFRLI